jgi:hypothetical protein
LEEAQRRFRDVYLHVREIDRNVAAVLNSGGCDIVSIEGGELVFGFKHEKLLERVQRPASMAALEQGVAEVLGAGLTVRCRQDPAAVDRLQLLAAERPSHLLDEALKLGARPVERE